MPFGSSKLDVLVSLLIIGPPKEWPSGVNIGGGDHIGYSPASRPLWLANAVKYNEDHCRRCATTVVIMYIMYINWRFIVIYNIESESASVKMFFGRLARN